MSHHDLPRPEAVHVINQLIAQHNIGRRELMFLAKRSSPRIPREKGVIRFRHPETGKTWTGVGRPPEWFKAHPNAREAFKV